MSDGGSKTALMDKMGTSIPVRVCLSYSVLQLLEGGDLTKLKTNWWYDRSECGKGELQVQFFSP